MNLVDVLDALGVDYREGGSHRHVRHGWYGDSYFRGTCFHHIPRSIARTVPGATPCMTDNLLESSLWDTPLGRIFSASIIDNTTASVNLAVPDFSPRLSVPWRMRSAWFSSGVPQHKLLRLLFCLSPSR